MRKKLTEKNSPEYLTVRECQEICRFRGPYPIRYAFYRGELEGTRISSNRTLILASSFWKWFHRNDVDVSKSKVVDMPAGPIKKPREKQTA